MAYPGGAPVTIVGVNTTGSSAGSLSTTTTPLTAGTDRSGTATVTFTRAFNNKPGFSITEIDAAGSQPLVCVVTGFVGTGPYTGCTIKGYRSQALPSQGQLSIASLLTGVINGVNALAASLTGFNIFGGSASGASVSVVAIARSDV